MGLSLGGPLRGRSRATRRTDSVAVRRRRGRIGMALIGLGLIAAGVGLWADTVPDPEPVTVATPGRTALPEVRFFQNPWAVFANIPDRRRPPTLAGLGCRLEDGRIPAQPADFSVYGSRVVDDVSIAPTTFLGRPHGAVLVCDRATAYGPVLAMPVTAVPPFTPTALVILGIVLLVAAALVHPATADLQQRWGSRQRRSVS